MPAVLIAEGGFQRRDVVDRHEARAGHQRFKILAVLGLSGDRESAEGAPVEAVLQRDHLVFFGVDGAAVRVHHLERAFHRLGPRIGEEAALQSAHLRQPLGQRTLILVIVEIRRMDQQPGLFADDFGQARMGVTERVDADTGDEVQVALAGHII